MNNTTVDVRTVSFSSSSHGKINHKMSASNEKLLYEAASDGDLEKVKELLSKGVGTGYRDWVS